MADLTQWNKMLSGELYKSSDPYLMALRAEARAACQAYNLDKEAGKARLAQLLGGCRDFSIQPDFRCDYLRNLYLGEHFYANTGLVVLDVCEVRIGDNVLIGPQVGIYTAAHPLDYRLRRRGEQEGEYGKPITIGNDVWIGGHATINPGVKIGDRAVVASGAVVTHDVPPDTLVAGCPARVIRKLN